jgi:hypothetical protein
LHRIITGLHQKIETKEKTSCPLYTMDNEVMGPRQAHSMHKLNPAIKPLIINMQQISTFVSQIVLQFSSLLIILQAHG